MRRRMLTSALPWMISSMRIAGLTPTTVPGITTIHTAELERLLAKEEPIVIDLLLYSWGRSIPGAIGLKRAGGGGSTSRCDAGRVTSEDAGIDEGRSVRPIVTVGWNSERSLTAATSRCGLSRSDTPTYAGPGGGREAWEVNGSAARAAVDVQDW